MDTVTVYTSKNMSVSVSANELVHGRAYWKFGSSGQLEEFIYCDSHKFSNWLSGVWQNGLLSVVQYRAQKARLQSAKQSYYAQHPEIIRERIRAKRALNYKENITETEFRGGGLVWQT